MYLLWTRYILPAPWHPAGGKLHADVLHDLAVVLPLPCYPHPPTCLEIGDVRNEAGICDKSIHHVTSQPLSVLHWFRVNPYGCPLRSSKSKQKKKKSTCVVYLNYWSNNLMRPTDGNICTFSMLSGQLLSRNSWTIKCFFLKFKFSVAFYPQRS